MLAYTHTDQVERTCPNKTTFQKHIESVMGNGFGEFFNSMFQFSVFRCFIGTSNILNIRIAKAPNNQNSDVLAINI